MLLVPVQGVDTLHLPISQGKVIQLRVFSDVAGIAGPRAAGLRGHCPGGRPVQIQLPGASGIGHLGSSDAKGLLFGPEKAVDIDDLLDLPLIVSRQGLREDIPRLLGERADRLRVVTTINLAYNGGIFVREGLGYLLIFDRLVGTGAESDLCFRPLTPALETKLFVIWKKYQVFSPAAKVLLEEMKTNSGKP